MLKIKRIKLLQNRTKQIKETFLSLKLCKFVAEISEETF